MDLNFKSIDITQEEDWNELRTAWEHYFDREYSFDTYHELLSKLNFIVGFGRGFWAGVHDYFYLVYHKELDKFYWFLRNIERDTEVYFYEIDENSEIFRLLRSKPYNKNFDEYDRVLNYNDLYHRSIGQPKTHSSDLYSTELKTLFGEDTEPLRIALMNLKPATLGSKYPHKEFHKKFFLPHLELQLDKRIQSYNKAGFNVYKKDNKLFIKINDETFELKNVE